MSTEFTAICAIDDIPPNSGVCAMVDGRQVAIFRFGPNDALYALDNRDPFSGANVLSRGILGSAGDIPKVSSPLYKESFDLRTGQCIDKPEVQIDTFAVSLVDGQVLVGQIADQTADVA